MRIYTLTVGDDRYHINLDGLYAVKESNFKESFGCVALQFGDTFLSFNVQGFKSQEDYRAAVNNLLVAWKGASYLTMIGKVPVTNYSTRDECIEWKRVP